MMVPTTTKKCVHPSPTSLEFRGVRESEEMALLQKEKNRINRNMTSLYDILKMTLQLAPFIILFFPSFSNLLHC